MISTTGKLNSQTYPLKNKINESKFKKRNHGIVLNWHGNQSSVYKLGECFIYSLTEEMKIFDCVLVGH